MVRSSASYNILGPESLKYSFWTNYAFPSTLNGSYRIEWYVCDWRVASGTNRPASPVDDGRWPSWPLWRGPKLAGRPVTRTCRRPPPIVAFLLVRCTCAISTYCLRSSSPLAVCLVQYSSSVYQPALSLSARRENYK